MITGSSSYPPNLLRARRWWDRRTKRHRAPSALLRPSRHRPLLALRRESFCHRRPVRQRRRRPAPAGRLRQPFSPPPNPLPGRSRRRQNGPRPHLRPAACPSSRRPSPTPRLLAQGSLQQNPLRSRTPRQVPNRCHHAGGSGPWQPQEQRHWLGSCLPRANSAERSKSRKRNLRHLGRSRLNLSQRRSPTPQNPCRFLRLSAPLPCPYPFRPCG